MTEDTMLTTGGRPYLVWSNEHRMWWAPLQLGYTIHVNAAGRYTHKEALEICTRAIRGWRPGMAPPELMIPLADALAIFAGFAAPGPMSEPPDMLFRMPG